VGKRDLNIIAEVCYQIADDVEDVDKLPNLSKRIMLYCWYATNIYSLNGKGNRGKPSDRLEYAIKATYPEENSADWVGYKNGPNKKRKNVLKFFHGHRSQHPVQFVFLNPTPMPREANEHVRITRSECVAYQIIRTKKLIINQSLFSASSHVFYSG